MPKKPGQSDRASFAGSPLIAERYFEPASPDPLKTIAWELLRHSRSNWQRSPREQGKLMQMNILQRRMLRFHNRSTCRLPRPESAAAAPHHFQDVIEGREISDVIDVYRGSLHSMCASRRTRRQAVENGLSCRASSPRTVRRAGLVRCCTSPRCWRAIRSFHRGRQQSLSLQPRGHSRSMM